MKKIGVVSIYDNTNFGNRLQNYALVNFLNNMGIKAYSVVPIQIQNIPVKLSATLYQDLLCGVSFFSPKVRKSVARLIRSRNFRKFNRKIKSFLALSFDYYKLPKYLDRCFDSFIVGSDQVWNLNWVKPGSVFYNTFLLQSISKAKRNAYAASMGTTSFDSNDLQVFLKDLKSFVSISLREESSAKLIRSNIRSCPIEVCIDPVFLLTGSEWRSLFQSNTIALSRSKYIFAYFLGEKSDNIDKEIDRISKEHSLPVINVLRDEEYSSTGPEGFLSLIDRCELVLTDSFHAVAFSIIFNKPFIPFERATKNGVSMGRRIPDLLQKLGFKTYDYGALYWNYESFAEVAIKNEVYHSIKYLGEIISNA